MRRILDEFLVFGSLVGGVVFDFCYFIVKFIEFGECGFKCCKIVMLDCFVKIRCFFFGGRLEGYGSYVMFVVICFGVCIYGVKLKYFIDIRNCRMVGEWRKNIFVIFGSFCRFDYFFVVNLIMILDWCFDLLKLMI